ncbi:Protein BRANCHLESS TRICHOME like [Actinidia chinensis var. chinensis]|uniref:Protein BRANCHLESS TRICHOME like n=1 Tax=Actinidia chinensis var. chinensis TaxID=1590841 RepID=A0A2R6QMV0_ACTCC|nr:Protein BRANCHLESS TRICHOME like [Actinidia chinensis var. chinensis]
MEEMMMMMMIRSPANPTTNQSNSNAPITTSTCPTWKLYENPFYYTHHQHSHHHHHQQQQEEENQQQLNTRNKQLHRLHLPISARKIAASFWDLTFIRPIMDSELDIARAQIVELKAELEYERKARKKTESVNKKLTRELSEERKGREAYEQACGELVRQISAAKAEIGRMRREMEEERKMLRMAEVLREERVQMKLNEAKLLLQEKILELEVTKQIQTECSSTNSMPERKIQEKLLQPILATPRNYSADHIFSVRCVSGEKSNCDVDNNGNIANSLTIQRRPSPEPENPHIKRGIKGFVEFPKVVRAIGSRSRHLGTKLECQKAQLRILLKQKNPIRSNNLIMS